MFKLVALSLLLAVGSTLILPEYEHCDVPLGMESGLIADRALSASSTHDRSSVGPRMSRIRTELEGGAWCPAGPIGSNSFEYLQIELDQLVFVNAIETQGRFDNGQGNEYAEFYQIQYQREKNGSTWLTYSNKKTNQTIIKGNVNTYLAEKRFLQPPIVARRVRILPSSPRWRTVCMRVELYGCPFEGGLISYTTTPLSVPDPTYDGEKGLGKLTDGIFAGAEENWLVWKTSPVTLRFQFDRLHRFELIRIYSVKDQYRSVEIQFDRSISIRPRRLTMDRSSSVFVDTIVLSDYGDESMFIGEEIQIQIEFDGESLFLTEITFENEPTSVSPNRTRCTQGEKSSLHWLLFVSLSLLFVLFCLLGIHQQFRLRKKTIESPPTTTTSERLEKRNAYDDIISMGSYITPITSATSLLPSDQYAVIDTHSLSETREELVHYASSAIRSFSQSSLFNCTVLEELLPSKSTFSLPPSLDASKLTSLSLLSQSTCGEIFSGTYSLTQSVLIKMIKVKFIEASREKFLTELNLVSRLKNAHLACLCAVQLERLCLVQEYSELGTVQDYFRRQIFDDDCRRNVYFAYQLSDALEYLASANLVHNDVAARNCLFYADYSLKLTDCAKAFAQFDDEYWQWNNGEKIPLRWIAPEVLTKHSTLKSDVYSFAVTLWQFWSRCSSLPHSSLSDFELSRCFLARPRLSQPVECPKEIYDLLCECWQTDDRRRPNIAEISVFFKRQVHLQ